ncbi:MAG TPA: hypothetical protein VEC02_03270 [Nitrososphaerales archaeon]|nr:hypothetical protein [Nitrososphaerales archaeon]
MALALGPLILFSLNVLSAVVAFLTSYFAYRFERVADSPLLKAITVGFMLLGVGLLAEAGTSVALGQTLVDVLKSRVLAVLATFTYLSIQVLAYVIFAAGYCYVAFGRGWKVASAAILAVVSGRIVDFVGFYRFAVASYFVALVLLAFVVFQGVLIHSRSRSSFSLLVMLAFVLILLAHVVLLVSVIDLAGVLFLAGTVIQFLGFVSLLVFLVRSARVGPA